MITNPSANIEPLVEYLKSVPFDVSRKTLYNAAEIYEGFNLEQPESFDNCFDTQVYRPLLLTLLGSLQTVFVKMPFLHLPLVVLSIRRVVRELCKRFSRMLCRTTIYHLGSLVQ